jgi:2-keto-4-pentenoate hydratase
MGGEGEMTEDRIGRAAALLAEAHRTGVKLPGLPEADAPTTTEEAWAIQQAVLHLRGAGIGGFKAAVPPDRPGFGAIMPASGLLASPAALHLKPGETIGIEAEIAFRVLHDIPQGASEAELLAAIVAFPAIELVASRYQDGAPASQLVKIADNFSNAGFVAGPDAPGWRGLDLSQLHVHLRIGDAVIADRHGGNPAGDPLVPLRWLAGFLPSVGLQLLAGQVVTTGSCTGMVQALAGQRVTARFEGLGEVVIDC